jgi:ubiquitin-like protein Pup
MAQTQKKKSSKETTTEQAPVESKKSDTAEKTVADAEAMMDKIDGILDTFNAEEFIAAYVQKSGE